MCASLSHIAFCCRNLGFSCGRIDDCGRWKSGRCRETPAGPITRWRRLGAGLLLLISFSPIGLIPACSQNIPVKETVRTGTGSDILACDRFGVIARQTRFHSESLHRGRKIHICDMGPSPDPREGGPIASQISLLVQVGPDSLIPGRIRGEVPLHSVAFWDNRQTAPKEFFPGKWTYDSDHELASDVFLIIRPDLYVIQRIAASCEVEPGAGFLCGPMLEGEFSFVAGQGQIRSGQLEFKIDTLLGVGPSLKSAKGRQTADKGSHYTAYKCGLDAICIRGMGILLRE